MPLAVMPSRHMTEWKEGPEIPDLILPRILWIFRKGNRAEHISTTISFSTEEKYCISLLFNSTMHKLVKAKIKYMPFSGHPTYPKLFCRPSGILFSFCCVSTFQYILRQLALQILFISSPE